jgi:hypothetical protein
MGLRRNRLIALVAAGVLIVCAAVYSAHGFADRAHEHSHCDLCVHLSGTAGAPAAAAVIGKPVRVIRALPAPAALLLPTRSRLGAHLPRGPPLLSRTAI